MRKCGREKPQSEYLSSSQRTAPRRKKWKTFYFDRIRDFGYYEPQRCC